MSIAINKSFKFMALVLTHLTINGWMTGSYSGGMLTAQDSDDFGSSEPH